LHPKAFTVEGTGSVVSISLFALVSLPLAHFILFQYTPAGKVINIGGKRSIKVDAGDTLRIATPGGGGYGKRD
jgi:hypothetical protein